MYVQRAKKKRKPRSVFQDIGCCPQREDALGSGSCSQCCFCITFLHFRWPNSTWMPKTERGFGMVQIPWPNVWFVHAASVTEYTELT